MIETANSKINVVDLMRRIRQEVARRKALGLPRLPEYRESVASKTDYSLAETQAVVVLPRLPESKECVANKTDYSLAELLNYDDDCFIRSAYLAMLRRAPDATGCARYLHMLRTGQLSKAEILGRLRYSPEGKACATAVHGLLLPFVVQSAYRIPVLGYGVALANFLLRLPVIIRNRVNFEANMVRQQREQVAQINVLAAQIESALSDKAGNSEVTALASELEGSRVSFEATTLRQQREEVAQINALVVQIESALSEKAGRSELTALASELEGKRVSFEAGAVRQQREQVAQINALAAQIERALSEKAGNSELIALASELEAMRAISVPRQDVDALQQKVFELSSKAETALGDAHMELLGQKAATAKVEALAAQTQEQVLSLNKAVKTKADNERLTQLTNHLVALMQRKTDATELTTAVTRLGEALAQKADAATTQQATREIQRQIRDHKHSILDQQRRLVLLLEEARKRLPEPISTEQITNMVAEEDHLLDAFYVSFEDRFRGTRDDIKQRVAVYLPVVKEAKAGTKSAPILDIACGRGEWLQLLHENDLVGRGVDLNRVMVSQCQELGLEVTEADAIAYLRNLKANSLGAVTGMHIIEHMPFRKLIALFDEVLRVLQPGGVAIFETPNPENLLVGACNFYYDPTHLNPLPPEPMRFIIESRGFATASVLKLHPFGQHFHVTDGAKGVNSVLNQYLFGPQDYAVIGKKRE